MIFLRRLKSFVDTPQIKESDQKNTVPIVYRGGFLMAYSFTFIRDVPC